MKKRYADAVSIQEGGASNVSGVALTLLDAIHETRDEGNNADHDIACRLIAHQLAFLFGVTEVDHDYCKFMEKAREYANTAP